MLVNECLRTLLDHLVTRLLKKTMFSTNLGLRLSVAVYWTVQGPWWVWPSCWDVASICRPLLCPPSHLLIRRANFSSSLELPRNLLPPLHQRKFLKKQMENKWINNNNFNKEFSPIRFLKSHFEFWLDNCPLPPRFWSKHVNRSKVHLAIDSFIRSDFILLSKTP